MYNTHKKSVIIVAGGSGLRMGSEIPKQFLLLSAKPLLMQTLLRFFLFDQKISIVLVLPFDYIETWNQLCSQHRFIIPHQIVPGGENRYQSVNNGLAKIDDASLVAIHDGVRPLVSIRVIKECFDAAEKFGGAIPVVSLNDSIRRLEDSESVSLERKNYRLVQTPQTFRVVLIKEAYQLPYEDKFTDDASVFESAGNKIHCIEGNVENIKITRKWDLKLAELIMAGQDSDFE